MFRGVRSWSMIFLLVNASTPDFAGAQAAVILQYHHVSDSTPPSTSTAPARFAQHLDYLAANGFEVLPLQVLVDRLGEQRPLSERTAAITFDDGYRSIYDTAFPLLRARGWPFTVFVNTDPHDSRQRGFMTWDELRELSRNGATIANHTVSHPNLLDREPGQDDAAWRAWVAAEIAGAERRIEQEIGSVPKLLAYPFGEYDAAVLEITAAAGYVGFGQHSGPLAPFSDPRALPRFPFGGTYGDPADFATKVNSLPLPLAGGAGIRLETADGRPLADSVIYGGAAPPVLALKFQDDFDPSRLSCFVSGQGRVPVVVGKPWVTVQAAKPLPAGRSRYNCTAPSSQAGRYYWLTQPWVVRPGGG